MQTSSYSLQLRGNSVLGLERNGDKELCHEEMVQSHTEHTVMKSNILAVLLYKMEKQSKWKG